MGDKKFTFIELHLDGETQFGPKEISDALPGGKKLELDAETEPEETEDESEDAAAADDSGGKGAIGALVGLVLLAGLAIALKKLRGGDEPPIEEYDEPDVIVN